MIPLREYENNTSFAVFISEYKNVLRALFRDPYNERFISNSRGLPPLLLRDVMQCKPLNVFIEEENGGMGGNVRECLSMLEITSYESLPLSLMMGINGALFLQPVQKYAQPAVLPYVLKRFTQQQAMGGLMITEPDYGSDALHMQTSFERKDQGYRVQGEKHWAGLTGWADFWLLTARERKSDGALGRDIAFFIHDSRGPGIQVEELFNNLGLYMLPYGKNRIDVQVPFENRLEPPGTGIKMMLDMLHRSRLQFPGMATGFLRRIMEESMEHVMSRRVGGRELFTYDQVRERIARLQSWFTSSSAMCVFASQKASLKEDLSMEDLSANSIKAVVSDMMQEASQSFLQLVGAKGYKMDHLAGRSTVDSRPFQIFEGSNDILYQQIAESVLKKMKANRISSLKDFLSSCELTSKAAKYLEKYTRFDVTGSLSQRKQVLFGKVMGYVVSMNMVIELGEKGFQEEWIRNTVDILISEIRNGLHSVSHLLQVKPLEHISSDTDWYASASTQLEK